MFIRNFKKKCLDNKIGTPIPIYNIYIYIYIYISIYLCLENMYIKSQICL